MRLCPYCAQKPEDMNLHVFIEHENYFSRYNQLLSSFPSKPKARKPPKKKKIAILQGGYHCVKCNKPLPRHKATFDHIIPKSLGGNKHHTSNLQLMCADCNNKKGSSETKDYR